MNRSFTQAGARTLCLGLAALAALSWSCTKEPSYDGDTGQQAEGAIAQARSYYESTAPSLTKTVADQTVAIKPLPGDMTPLWDKASATVLSDGTTAWVDVPIEGTITYTAVRGGHHHHEVREDCGHNHDAVQAVQKLTVHTAADGTKQSLIATIVPEPDCTAELNGFSSVNGLAGFSGFVSWHDLTGKLVRVASYENGTKTKSVEVTGDNEAEVLNVVDEALLFPLEAGAVSLLPETKTFPEVCSYCEKENCPGENKRLQHCNMCWKYDPPLNPTLSECICARCSKCGYRLKGQYPTCVCPDKPLDVPKFCERCGSPDCPNTNIQFPSNSCPPPPYVVQESILKNILSSLTQEQFRELNFGSYATDMYHQSLGDEIMHGLYYTGDDEVQRVAHASMRAYFVNMAQAFVYHRSYYHLGRALHPIVDTYILVQSRIDMLIPYSYGTIWNIVDGRFVTPYTSDRGPCTQAVKYIYNALVKLPQTATKAQVEAVFDGWLKLTGGGY